LIVPSIAVIPREGSLALAFFGRTRKVQELGFALSAGQKSFALKRILEAGLVIWVDITNGKEQIVWAISHRGSSGTGGGWRFRGSYLGLVSDQLPQERNQHDERNTDCEAANASSRRGPASSRGRRSRASKRSE